MSTPHGSIDEQYPSFTEHHEPYAAIDPGTGLKGSASGKVIFLSGASQGIGQVTAVAFARTGAAAIYVAARSAKALEETRSNVLGANPDTKCEYEICDVTDERQVKSAIAD